MIEFLRHALGFCGEHWHPNIFTISLALVGGSQTVSYIHYKLTNKHRPQCKQ